MMKKLILLVVLSGIAACTSQSSVRQAQTDPEILTVQSDGTMVFNERTVNEKDVVIYPDGYGGERAAIRVYVPLKPDFFRDTIRVHREDADTDVIED
jgi:hypothetical protein